MIVRGVLCTFEIQVFSQGEASVKASFLKADLQVMRLLWGALLLAGLAFAQNPQVQERLAALKENSAKNKQALARYTWQEQDTISIKGEVKKQELFQVRLGPDGNPQKTSLTAAQPQADDNGGRRRGGRLKQKVVENKKEEFKEYADNIKALAHAYAQPDPQLLQQALQKGNVSIRPGSNGPSLVISNYLKPNDSMVIMFDNGNKGMQSVQISSYLDSQSDAVHIAVGFSQLPDGTNHVAMMNIDGTSKKLNVAVQNSNYQKL